MKFPTFEEFKSMSSKFAKDVTRSVSEIIAEYKQKQAAAATKEEEKIKEPEVKTSEINKEEKVTQQTPEIKATADASTKKEEKTAK